MPRNSVKSTSSQSSERHTLKEVKSVNSIRDPLTPHWTDSLVLLSHLSCPAESRTCTNLFVCMCLAPMSGFSSPCRLRVYNWGCFETLRGQHPQINTETHPHAYSTGDMQHWYTLHRCWIIHTADYSLHVFTLIVLVRRRCIPGVRSKKNCKCFWDALTLIDSTIRFNKLLSLLMWSNGSAVDGNCLVCAVS